MDEITVNTPLAGLQDRVESYLLLAAPFEDSRTSNRPQSEGVSV